MAFSGTATTTLIEHWNGTAWCTVPSPSPYGPNDFVFGVSATSATNAWAVGTTDYFQTIILHWDGMSWTTVPSPNPGGSNNQNVLDGVSATSATNAWAVGYYSTPRGAAALILHWNGTSWTQVPSPPNGPSNTANTLRAVAATRAATWAVGYCGGPCNSYTLTERWNGTAWTLVPNPGLGNLFGVAVTSSSNAWAVGGYYNGTADRNEIEHWNGSAWKRVTSPNRGGSLSDNILSKVAATSSANAWAVGTYTNSNHVGQTLILHWNGTAWSVQSSPNPSPGGDGLGGVAATSSSDAWAVGSYTNSNHVARTLILHWNGTSWSRVPSP